MNTQNIGRRELLKAVGGGAAAVIIGYSEEARAWIPAHGSRHHGPFTHVPRLDGELLTDEASRLARGTDLGNIIFNTPAAVLRPGSSDDIVKMIRFCKERNISVAARGQGHATHGQAQSRAGLVIDMSSMQQIHEIGSGFALVDGGCTWRMLLEESLLVGQTPPVLTGFIGLSIGGTLSMGGISGMAYNKGVQVQHVLELTVATGEGKLERCSLSKNRKLFEHVLAGLGQCGIIVRAKVKLIPAKERALDLVMRYDDVERFNQDLRTLVYRGEFDMVWGDAKPDMQGGWFYEINTTSFYTPPEAPNAEYMIRGLQYEAGSVLQGDSAYLEYHLRVDGFIAFLRSQQLFDNVMHPWFDVFIPDSEFSGYVGDIVSSFQPDDVGMFGFVLFFPLLTSTITRPLFRLPDEELVYLFDVLTARDIPGYDADFGANKLARNNAWYDMARSVGGTRYPIGSLDFSRGDWRRHYGREWNGFKAAKHDFDPCNILTPGPGIF